MSLAAPGRLWWLLAVAAIGVLYLVQQRRRPRHAVRFTNLELLASVAPAGPGFRRHLPAALVLAAAGLMVVGLAEPEREVEVPSDRSTVVLALDTSLSMAATDVAPDRISAAQDAAVGFIESVPESALVGVVEFNGIARTAVSPTTDRNTAVRAVERLQLGEATAIGEAIFAGLDAIEDARRQFDDEAAGDRDTDDGGDTELPALIVVMSDGETTTGRTNEEAVAAAIEAGVAVTTISFGTEDGTVLLPGDPIPVEVPVNADQLQAIAEATGGEFFPAADADELVAAFADIGTGVASETVTDPWHLPVFAAALVILAVAALASIAWSSKLP